MKLQEFLRRAPWFLARKRGKSDVILEPFAFVNGNDPDRVFITFQTQFMLIFQFAAEQNLPRQPLDQSINAESIFNANCMQQFDQMQNVREPTFAVAPV